MKCNNCGKEVGLHLHVIPIRIEGFEEVVFCSDECACDWAERNGVIK